MPSAYADICILTERVRKQLSGVKIPVIVHWDTLRVKYLQLITLLIGYQNYRNLLRGGLALIVTNFIQFIMGCAFVLIQV